MAAGVAAGVAAGPMIRLHSLRYGVPIVSEHEDVDAALRAAYWQIEDNSAAPVRLTDAEGRVIFEPLVFEKAVEHVGEEIEAAWETEP